VINIAHGAFYILSVYLGITVAKVMGGFVAAIIVDSVTIMVIAAVLHRLVLKRFHLAPLPQVLSMYGVTLIIVQAVRLIWGGYPEVMATPSGLEGTVQVLGAIVPTYRVFLIGVAVVLAIGLWLLIERRRARRAPAGRLPGRGV
jgi:branched-chain amino acid transport system permease protein